ncbi:MAG: GspH/FimT family protein [Pseudomonadota bacterium]
MKPPISSQTEPAAPADAGLTLLELLVVMTVLVLLATGLSGLGPAGVPSHEESVRQIMAGLTRARTQAIQRAAPVAYVIDPDRRRHGIGAAEAALPPEMRITVTSAAEAAQDGLPSVLFFPDGSASGGRIALASGGAERDIIDIRWLTGAIRRE